MCDGYEALTVRLAVSLMICSCWWQLKWGNKIIVLYIELLLCKGKVKDIYGIQKEFTFFVKLGAEQVVNKYYKFQVMFEFIWYVLVKYSCIQTWLLNTYLLLCLAAICCCAGSAQRAFRDFCLKLLWQWTKTVKMHLLSSCTGNASKFLPA